MSAVITGSELLARKVSFYAGVLDTTGRPVALAEIADAIRGGKWRGKIETIRAEPDEDKQAALKEELFGFTASGVFKRRNKFSISAPAGLLIIDIDHLGGMDRAVQMRDMLADDRHVLLAFVSCRGEGVKLLVYAGDLSTDADFKAAWRAFAQYAAETYGLELDPSGKDLARLCFISADPGALVNTGEIDPFTARAEIVKPDKAETPELPPAAVPGDWGEIVPDVPDAPPVANVRAALCHLDPGVEYGKWLRIGMAIKSAFPGADGFVLFDEWSRRAPAGRYGGTAEAWKSIKAEGGVTIGTLYASAEAEGWVNPMGKAYAEIRRARAAEAEAADSGDDPPEDPPKPRPWRGITDEQVLEAIAGSRLADMVAVLEGVTVPPLPIQYTLPKAIALAGCALAQPLKFDETTALKRGLDLARNVIGSSFGQLLNVWACIVGPSGSGKDIGNLPHRIAEDNGVSLGHAGSAEGLADALVGNGGGLLVVSELGPYLDSKSWQGKATGFLTAAFNQAQAKIVLSTRVKGIVRDVRYCAPSIIANVQPAVLKSMGDTLLLDSGFLNRFLFSHLPEIRTWRPNTERLDLGPLSGAFIGYRRMQARISVPQDYLQDVLTEFAGNDAPLPGHYNRLVNEYGPRLAAMLAADPNRPDEVVITDEHWRRVGILIRWFFGMAEEVLQGIGEEKFISRMEARLDRMFAFIKKHPKGIAKRLFSKRFSERGTTAAERDKDLAELEARGWIVIHTYDSGKTILKAVK